ncbi:DUF2515 family protein [Heyndrickxia acidicola]|uniref:DUF2515 family protein n=1 Tax=Heyndrickxia acidicola TaxID=209389 RepID=A0ABU6ML52_9BACI|nr:DUF2515 family protein [Heyndrickxia acidicola]MED1205034.1 DUF2515 family protein [Heyndrickxia acidicola]
MKENPLFQTIFPNISFNLSDQQIIQKIRKQTYKANLDNISRTKEYQNFYLLHPEIKWSFLASMVSRNAGWNMGDLEGDFLPSLISKKCRTDLFLTYERANWLIFHDAYPQLLLYHYSKLLKRPLLHLLKDFFVSDFMVEEWKSFLCSKDEDKLMTALIINEQNIIHLPVINHSTFKKRVFSTKLFKLQELFHFSCVLFPTRNGCLYGASVDKFRKLEERIHLGRRLASILFHPDLYPYFYDFAFHTEHTGSRFDYEKYMEIKKRDTPYLRTVYPIIEHHLHEQMDWSLKKNTEEQKLPPISVLHPIQVTDWFLEKQKKMRRMVLLKRGILGDC